MACGCEHCGGCMESGGSFCRDFLKVVFAFLLLYRIFLAQSCNRQSKKQTLLFMTESTDRQVLMFNIPFQFFISTFFSFVFLVLLNQIVAEKGILLLCMCLRACTSIILLMSCSFDNTC